MDPLRHETIETDFNMLPKSISNNNLSMQLAHATTSHAFSLRRPRPPSLLSSTAAPPVQTSMRHRFSSKMVAASPSTLYQASSIKSAGGAGLGGGGGALPPARAQQQQQPRLTMPPRVLLSGTGSNGDSSSNSSSSSAVPHLQQQVPMLAQSMRGSNSSMIGTAAASNSGAAHASRPALLGPLAANHARLRKQQQQHYAQGGACSSSARVTDAASRIGGSSGGDGGMGRFGGSHADPGLPPAGQSSSGARDMAGLMAATDLALSRAREQLAIEDRRFAALSGMLAASGTNAAPGEAAQSLAPRPPPPTAFQSQQQQQPQQPQQQHKQVLLLDANNIMNRPAAAAAAAVAPSALEGGVCSSCQSWSPARAGAAAAAPTRRQYSFDASGVVGPIHDKPLPGDGLVPRDAAPQVAAAADGGGGAAGRADLLRHAYERGFAAAVSVFRCGVGSAGTVDGGQSAAAAAPAQHARVVTSGFPAVPRAAPDVAARHHQDQEHDKAAFFGGVPQTLLEKTPIPSPFQDPAAPHSDDVAARGDGAADDARWPAAAADQKALETSTSTVSSSEGSNSICICAVEAPANNALLLPPARAARRLTFYD